MSKIPEHVQDIIDEIEMKRGEIQALNDEIEALLHSDENYSLYIDAFYAFYSCDTEPMSIREFYKTMAKFEKVNGDFAAYMNIAGVDAAMKKYGDEIHKLEVALLY